MRSPSIYSRLVFWAIAISVAVVVALWGLTHSTVERMTGEALARAVDVDLAGLADIHASGGEAELARRIEDRLALVGAQGNVPHYLLARGDGTRLAGDLERWPGLRAQLSQSGTFALADGGQAYGRATQLGPDLRLVVARERGDDAALLHQIALVFLVAGAGLVLAVGAIGHFAARGLARRIGLINLAFRNPREDQLEALETTGHGRDEIEELTAHSAAALRRQARLVAAHRETSDQVAHEMRTPLMHLDHRLVKALRAEPDGPVAGLLMEARAEIRRLITMLESLLDIAASKARRGDRHGLKPVDLSALVLRLAELYADSAEESGHRFTWQVAPGVAMDGEEIQLTRLITNLLDNAFKYVPAGGTVELQLEPGPVLIVRDDGPGIPAADRERIFDRFHRAGGSGAGEGAGLGLALCRAIAERHGLSIELSEAGHGACFVVSGEG